MLYMTAEAPVLRGSCPTNEEAPSVVYNMRNVKLLGQLPMPFWMSGVPWESFRRTRTRVYHIPETRIRLVGLGGVTRLCIGFPPILWHSPALEVVPEVFNSVIRVLSTFQWDDNYVQVVQTFSREPKFTRS